MNNSILTNMTSLLIQNNYNSVNDKMSTTLERMASGIKINQAKDDASGCVISAQLKNKINGISQAQRNIQDGAALLNTAQGAYQNMSNILTKLRDISLMAMDDSYDQSARKAFEDEANELTNQLEQIRKATKYNGISLFDNSNTTNQSAATNQSTINNLADVTSTGYSLRNSLYSLNSETTSVSTSNPENYNSIQSPAATIQNEEIINEGNDIAEISETEGEEEIPMMMSIARSASVEPIDWTTITFAKNETKIINIGNNSYEVKASNDSSSLNFIYKQDENGQITFDADRFTITALNDEANNIVIKSSCSYLELYLKSTDDIIEIRGVGCHIISEGGNNEVKISAEQTRLILNGNGNDTVHSSSYYVNQYIYLGEGDDDISGLRADNSIVAKKSGNVSYTSSRLKNCTLLNIDKTDSELQFMEIGSGSSTITINGRQYQIQGKNSSQTGAQHLFYKYDQETQRVTFIGYNAKVTAQANTSEKSILYGVDSHLYGTAKNDDLLVGIGSFNCTVYGKDGDDLIVTEEFTTYYSNYLYGGKGNDTLIGNSKTGYWGEEGDDTIIINTQASSSGATGGEGNDYFEINGKTTIFDTSGDNTYYINTDNITADVGGSTGKFIINGNNNTITGTDGDDYFEINGANNVINGGNGDDYYTNNNSSSNIQNALDATTNGKLSFTTANETQTFTVAGRTYTIKNLENATKTLYWHYENGQVQITGSNFDISADNDIEHNIAVDGNSNIIRGGNKNDNITILNGENNSIYGNDGDDTINLNIKNNSVDGGKDNDIININVSTSASIKGGEGDDTFNFNADNITNVQGGNGNDNFSGNTSNSKINLGNGNNNINIVGNNNNFIAGANNNTFEIEGNSNSITSNGNTEININGNNNSIYAQDGTIETKVYGNSNSINASNATNSTVRIQGDSNYYTGSKGDDEIIIAGNYNTAQGEKGNDNFIIDQGLSNKVDGGMGRNTIYDLGINTEIQNMINVTPKPFDLNLQIGNDANETTNIRILYTIGDFELNFNSSKNARENIAKIDKLQKQIDEQLSDIGAALNRLDSIYELNCKEIENLSLANSIIKDTDIAQEAVNFTKNQIFKDLSASLITQSRTLNANLVFGLLGIRN